MCHIVLFSPILALPLFLFLPIRTALPAYFAVVVAAGFIYFKIITAMKAKVRTGMEWMVVRNGWGKKVPRGGAGENIWLPRLKGDRRGTHRGIRLRHQN
jgi:hypothetical protein